MTMHMKIAKLTDTDMMRVVRPGGEGLLAGLVQVVGTDGDASNSGFGATVPAPTSTEELRSVTLAGFAPAVGKDAVSITGLAVHDCRGISVCRLGDNKDIPCTLRIRISMRLTPDAIDHLTPFRIFLGRRLTYLDVLIDHWY